MRTPHVELAQGGTCEQSRVLALAVQEDHEESTLPPEAQLILLAQGRSTGSRYKRARSQLINPLTKLFCSNFPFPAQTRATH